MTKGTCASCDRTMGKAAMTRHVASCGDNERGPQAAVVSVCDRHAPSDYWLHLEIPMHATLRALDDYLRDVWLECCGHLSMFEIDGRTYGVSTDRLSAGPDPFDDFSDASMDVAIGLVLGPGQEALHVYDMGSTTELRVHCHEQRTGHRDGAIRLLARNDRPSIDCAACGAPATTICTQCSWDGAGSLCGECATGHACDVEVYLPVVNSPRSGVCGYAGDLVF